jgi:DNA-binding MarR family transcriptional regulator
MNEFETHPSSSLNEFIQEREGASVTAKSENTLPALVEVSDDQEAGSWANFVELYDMLGKVFRKNHIVINNAFALTKDATAKAVLHRLSKSGPMTQKQLLQEVKTSKGNLSSVVNTLLDNHIIQECEEKGKHGSRPLQIHGDYLEIIQNHANVVERLVKSAFHVLSGKERKVLLSSLERVLDKLNSIDHALSSREMIYLNLEAKPAAAPTEENGADKTQDTQSMQQDKIKKKSRERSAAKGEISKIIERQTRTISEVTETEIHYK